MAVSECNHRAGVAVISAVPFDAGDLPGVAVATAAGLLVPSAGSLRRSPETLPFGSGLCVHQEARHRGRSRFRDPGGHLPPSPRSFPASGTGSPPPPGPLDPAPLPAAGAYLLLDHLGHKVCDPLDPLFCRFPFPLGGVEGRLPEFLGVVLPPFQGEEVSPHPGLLRLSQGLFLMPG